MEKTELQAYREKLLAMKADLIALQESAKDSTDTVVLDQSSIGRLSRMDALQGQQMALESERRRKQQLQKIEAALQRIDKNDYAYCLVCDEDIAPARLAIDPTATRCVGCSQ